MIPYPLALKILSETRDRGQHVLVFSQDDDLAEALKARVEFIWSKDLCPSQFTNSQRALFDIVLMSRCSLIYAGHSGFSAAASYIGDVDVSDIMAKVDVDAEWLPAYVNEMGDLARMGLFPPLHVAYAYTALLSQYWQRLSASEVVRLVREAWTFDDKNLTFGLYAHQALVAAGDFVAADAILEELLTPDRIVQLDICLRVNIANKSLRTFFVGQHFILTLESAVERGSLASAKILVMCAHYDPNIVSEAIRIKFKELIRGADIDDRILKLRREYYLAVE